MTEALLARTFDLSEDGSRRLTRNNFDLLRLLFAATVCLVHSAYLSGYQVLAGLVGFLSGPAAVKAFFVVSGFLIFMSYERSTSLASYASKRIRRIYPAYVTVVVLCAVLLAAVSSQTLGDYFSLGWLKYLAANLVFLNFLQPTLPGVFASNTMAEVNGALWTLKIEVMFYLAVPLFGYLFKRFSLFWVLLLTYCLSVAYSAVLATVAERTGAGIYVQLGRQLPGQLCYFMAGAFLYYFRALFERRIAYFMLLAVVVLLIDSIYALPLFEPFALASVVVFFGLFLYVGNFGKYGDFSYGVYIIHVPVIQLAMHWHWFHDSPWQFLAAVTVITTSAAIALWHLVEKRFLLRGSHYVASNAASGGRAAG